MKPAKAKPSQPQRREADGFAEKEDPREPLRQCIVTRERYPKEVMIRFVVGPDNVLVPDLQARLPGRGAWVIADRPALEAAIAKRLFVRALDEPVSAPADLSDRVGALLSRRCLDLLGQALGAGQLVLGSGAVQSLARAGEAAVLIEATDGAPDGRRKNFAAFKAGGAMTGPEHERAMVIGCFTSSELSLALGRQNVIHAALPEGGLASRFMAEARRLEGFRKLIPEAWSRNKGPAGPGSGSDE